MPDQIIPITGLDTVGLIKDNPPVSLPPNAFTDVSNVRFKDGAVRKMEGEVNLFEGFFDNGTKSYDGRTLKYCAWWPNPNIIANQTGYYIMIVEETVGAERKDKVYLLLPNATGFADSARVKDVTPPIATLGGAGSAAGGFTPDTQAAWQHTFFQGGFAVVINNGLNEPYYIVDADGNQAIANVPPFQPLPGWESYNVDDNAIIGDIFSEEINSLTFDTNRPASLVAGSGSAYNLLIEVRRPTSSTRKNISVLFTDFTASNETATSIDSNTNQNVSGIKIDWSNAANVTVNFESIPSAEALQSGDEVTIRFRTRNPVRTRAGVIRAFGDFLVAGNLVERDATTNAVIRNLAGIVRTSDVAPPGSVPTNWNPFAAGVSTADEFTLTASGVVQEMSELQGNFYIYSNSSISVMRQTGNPQVPLSVAPITESYGAQTTQAVLEFDGRHFIVGSQDLYVFAGHPGSIQSVSDQKVRRYFYDRLNPLHVNRMFCLRYAQRDEIWVCYPTTSSIRGECDEALIWNYRQNIWTIRSLDSVVAGDIGAIPGGGIPASNLELSGNMSGDNQAISVGQAGSQRLFMQNQYISGRQVNGINARYSMEVTNLPDFNAPGRIAFDMRMPATFDSGPNYGVINGSSGDGVYHTTQALRAVLTLENEGMTTRTAVVQLPRFLTVDKMWVPTITEGGMTVDRIYFTGQRVISPSNNMIYVAGNPFGDGTIPASFYDPNNATEIYSDANTTIYHDMRAAIPNPEFVDPANAPDGHWTLATDQTMRDTSYIAQQVIIAMQANDAFNESFEIIPSAVTDEVIVRPKGLSGQNGLPAYDTSSISFTPDISMLPMGNPANGGDGQVTFQNFETADPADMAGPNLNFLVHTNTYVVDDMAIQNNGYQRGTPVSISVALAGNYAGAAGNALAARHINHAFVANPMWNTTYTNGTNSLRIDAIQPAHLEIEKATNAMGESIFITNNLDTPIPDSVVTITYNRRGCRPNGATDAAADDDMNLQRAYPPVFKITPPDQTPLDKERDPVYVYGRTDLASGAAALNAVGPVDWFAQILDQVTVKAGVTTPVSFGNWTQGPLIGAGNNAQNITLTTSAEADHPSFRYRPANRRVFDLWQVELVDRGNLGIPIANVNDDAALIINLIQTPPLAATTAGLGFTATVVNNGFFEYFSTPSYIGILINNSEAASGLEFIALQAGAAAQTINNTAAVNKWVGEILTRLPRLSIINRGSGQFFIQPANYDDLANFVLDIRLNDTIANAQWMYEIATNGMVPATLVDGTVPSRAGMAVTVNPNSETLFVNAAETSNPYTYTNPLSNLRDGGPLKVGQHRGTGTLTNSSYLSSKSDFSLDTTVTTDFDLDRPWPSQEINPNQEFPILSASAIGLDGTDSVRLNKLLGADVGWSRPSFNITAAMNDQVTPYVSFVERVQMPISPEFNTEQLQSVALWADGETVTTFAEPARRNKLRMSITTTNNPGESTSLTATTGPKRNDFEVSQEYKMDMRTHGRFTNYRIEDFTFTGDADFNPLTEWRVSGMQATVKMGGTR